MKNRRTWEKVDLSEYSIPGNNTLNEIELNEIERDKISKINFDDIFPFDEIDDFDKEMESLEKEDRDWHSGVSEEEIIMRALENGDGDLFGFG